MTSKAIVLLSGGIDSAVVMWLAKRKWQVYALTFKFNKSNSNETRAAKKLAKIAKIEKHFFIDVNFLKQVSELKQLKRNFNFKKMKIPTTYIPSRNTIFFGIASYFSEILGAKYIVSGHSYIDPFPDSKSKYVKTINNALLHGSWLGRKYRTKILMPIAKLNKTKIVNIGVKLKVPLELTWSCYKNGKVSCGKCDGCISKLSAFEELNLL